MVRVERRYRPSSSKVRWPERQPGSDPALPVRRPAHWRVRPDCSAGRVLALPAGPRPDTADRRKHGPLQENRRRRCPLSGQEVTASIRAYPLGPPSPAATPAAHPLLLNIKSMAISALRSFSVGRRFSRRSHRTHLFPWSAVGQGSSRESLLSTNSQAISCAARTELKLWLYFQRNAACFGVPHRTLRGLIGNGSVVRPGEARHQGQRGSFVTRRRRAGVGMPRASENPSAGCARRTIRGRRGRSQSPPECRLSRTC